MFKKPLKDTKTSAPLRASDRRKLRDRIVAKFCPNNPDDGNVLVPDGLQSMKIATHSGEPGETSDSLPNAGDIVYVASWARDSRGPALAIGTMLLDSEKIISENVSKGKAVAIIHTWKDHLWAMGSQSAPPETVPASPAPEDSGAGGAQSQEERDSASNPSPDTPNGSFQQAEAAESSDGPSQAALTAEEISNILREALLQAIQTTISSLPPSAFPIPASTFYTTYILPARPLHVASASPPVDIKHSSFKALKSFLKHAEKQGLLRLKDARGDTLIASVNLQHEDVAHRAMHRTVGDLEGNMKKQKEKEEQREQEEQAREKQISVIELWKPHTTTVKLFEEAKLDTSALYTLPELKSALNGYISTHELINKGEQQFINVDADPILRDALWPQSGKKPSPVPEFAKREEALSTLCARMQTWHRIQIGTGDPIVKKGQLEPVSVVVKIRQGRKACTLVTGHEPFLLSSATIAEALRSRCASATSVAPLPGRAAGEEVMIQGKQTKIVMDYLKAMGVPKKWIKAEDTTDKKKK